MTRRAWLLLSLLLAALAGLWGSRPVVWERRFDAPDALTVLFVGNSQTYVNDVPALVAQLAHAAGDRPLGYDTLVGPGKQLSYFLEAGTWEAAARSRAWDAVVLQEQTWTSSDPSAVEEVFLPAARRMAADVRGSRILLTQLWGYAAGAGEGDTPAAMRARIRAHLGRVAAEVGGERVPAGDAVEEALAKLPGVAIWDEDGVHATLAGSYLAACAHYGTLYRRPVSDVPFDAGRR